MSSETPQPSSRTHRLHIRLTAAEHAALEDQARAANTSVSDLVRSRVLHHPRRSPVRTAMARAADPGFRAMHPVLFAELSRLGNNINQLARAYNSTRDVDRAAVMRLVAQTWQLMLSDEVTARYATMAEAKVKAKAAP